MDELEELKLINSNVYKELLECAKDKPLLLHEISIKLKTFEHGWKNEFMALIMNEAEFIPMIFYDDENATTTRTILDYASKISDHTHFGLFSKLVTDQYFFHRCSGWFWNQKEILSFLENFANLPSNKSFLFFNLYLLFYYNLEESQRFDMHFVLSLMKYHDLLSKKFRTINKNEITFFEEYENLSNEEQKILGWFYEQLTSDGFYFYDNSCNSRYEAGFMDDDDEDEDEETSSFSFDDDSIVEFLTIDRKEISRKIIMDQPLEPQFDKMVLELISKTNQIKK